jgi:hypothetical protein
MTDHYADVLDAAAVTDDEQADHDADRGAAVGDDDR